MIFTSALDKLPAYPMYVTNLTASPILGYLTVREITIRIFSGFKKKLMKQKCLSFIVVKKETKSLSDLGVIGLIWSVATNLHSHDGIVARRACPVLVIFGPPGDSNECLVFIITRCHFPVASVLVWCNVTRKRHGHCQNYQPSFHHVYLFFCCSSDTFRRLRMFCDVIRDLVSGFLFLMSGLIRSDRSMQLIFFAFWKIMPATKCGNNKMSVWRSRLGAE